MRAISSLLSRRFLLPLCMLAALGGGCSDSTAPAGGGDPTGTLPLDGSFDAEDGLFLLAISDSVPGGHLAVELIGSNLELDPAEDRLSLDVAIRNIGPDLYPPLMIWLRAFRPENVSVENPDAVEVSGGLRDVLPPAYGFDYSGLLGEDGVLHPGELSGAKRWIFHDPGLVSFAFAARLDAGLQPDLAVVGGRVWEDLNANGRLEEGEPGWSPARLVMETPDGQVLETRCGPDGRYRLPASTAGLYRLTCDLSEAGVPPPFFTTPNPLAVLLAPGPDGLPQSFLDANFGLRFGPPPDLPPVVFTDSLPSELHFAPWNLIAAGIEEDRLSLRVGFSGCQPEHPWTFYISGGFMESWPVQVKGVLVHEREEDCDAYFEKALHFDLRPLKEAYIAAYGPDGRLLLNLIDYQNAMHQLEYWIAGPDSTPPGDGG